MKICRFALACLLVALLAFSAVPLAQAEGDDPFSTEQLVKFSDDSNVRAEPNLDAKSLGTLKKGNTAKYLGETKTDERGVDWHKVEFKNGFGWVSAKYGALSVVEASTSSGLASKSPITPQYLKSFEEFYAYSGVTFGMTEAEVIAVLGEPDYESTEWQSDMYDGPEHRYFTYRREEKRLIKGVTCSYGYDLEIKFDGESGVLSSFGYEIMTYDNDEVDQFSVSLSNSGSEGAVPVATNVPLGGGESATIDYEAGNGAFCSRFSIYRSQNEVLALHSTINFTFYPSGSDLGPVPGGTSSGPSVSLVTPFPSVATVKITGNANVRAEPNLDAKSLGTLKKGDTPKYLGETKTDERGVDWHKVEFKNGSGWISSKYGKLDNQ